MGSGHYCFDTPAGSNSTSLVAASARSWSYSFLVPPLLRAHRHRLLPHDLASCSFHRRRENRPRDLVKRPCPQASHMERSAPEYTQSGLPSPYPSTFGDNNSEGSTADQPSAAAAAQYPVKQEYNAATAPATATPTSEYGVYPPSARSGSFPEHIRGSYPGAGASSGSMAQQQNSPSMPQQDGRNHQPHGVRSDNDVPIDPSIAAASPTYQYPPQHSPYGPNPDMAHGYPHPSGGMYPQARPDWAGYGGHGASPMTPGHMYNSPSAAPQQRPNQVCSKFQMSVLAQDKKAEWLSIGRSLASAGSTSCRGAAPFRMHHDV